MASSKSAAGPTTYRAFLIRLWCDAYEGNWYASAQLVQSRDVMRFATLQALFAYLEDATHRSQSDSTATAQANDAPNPNTDE